MERPKASSPFKARIAQDGKGVVLVTDGDQPDFINEAKKFGLVYSYHNDINQYMTVNELYETTQVIEWLNSGEWKEEANGSAD